MAIHVQDEETDWLVRELAKKRGLGITAAIKVAVQEALSQDQTAGDALAQRLEPVLKLVRAHRNEGFSEDDKEFMDDMWGEND